MFACMECGHKFRTVKAAEKAAYGDHGCPKCGGSDIDLAKPKLTSSPKLAAVAAKFGGGSVLGSSGTGGA